MTYTIGVDLGGTKVEVGLVAEDGTLVRSERASAESTQSPEVILEKIWSMIQTVQGEDEVAGIGFSTPGFVDQYGVMRNTPNNPSLEGFSGFLDFFCSRTDLPLIQENDANCFAYAEATCGVGQGADLVLGVIWGTGVGGGLVENGQIYRGYNGGGMEIGNTRVFGEQWTIEDLCTGEQPLARYKELGGTQEELTFKFIMDKSDEVAAVVRAECIGYMALALANWAHILQPEVIVLGGGVSNTNMYEELNGAFKKLLVPSIAGHIEIKKHGISDSAGMIGAAMLVR